MDWDERVTMLSINPDAATRDDVARLAGALMTAEARVLELECVGWRPIETAPKDGTKILVFGQIIREWRDPPREEFRACISSWHDMETSIHVLTGWLFSAPGHVGIFNPAMFWASLPKEYAAMQAELDRQLAALRGEGGK